MSTVPSASLALDSILSPVSEEMQSVDLFMRDALATGFPEMDRCSSYVIDGGGKRIRSALVLLCSGLTGSFPSGVYRLAAGAEIVHAATLLHDDVIDCADTRRGRQTVSSRWGNRTAVLLGDFMLAKALDIAVSAGRRDQYSPLVDAAREMVSGEFLQNRYSGLTDLTEELYFSIAEKKTGAFMGSCCFLGAACTELPDGERTQLRMYGTELGIAFQIIDDLLDYSGDGTLTGKAPGNDYLNGKITLPVIRALCGVGGSERELLVSCFRQPLAENWETVRSIVAGSGAVESCAATAHDMAEKARERLGVFPESTCRGILEELSRFIVERVY